MYKDRCIKFHCAQNGFYSNEYRYYSFHKPNLRHSNQFEFQMTKKGSEDFAKK